MIRETMRETRMPAAVMRETEQHGVGVDGRCKATYIVRVAIGVRAI